MFVACTVVIVFSPLRISWQSRTDCDLLYGFAAVRPGCMSLFASAMRVVIMSAPPLCSLYRRKRPAETVTTPQIFSAAFEGGRGFDPRRCVMNGCQTAETTELLRSWARGE